MRTDCLQGSDEGRRGDRLGRCAPAARAAASGDTCRTDRDCPAARRAGPALGSLSRAGARAFSRAQGKSTYEHVNDPCGRERLDGDISPYLDVSPRDIVQASRLPGAPIICAARPSRPGMDSHKRSSPPRTVPGF
ncbi:protein of unknown function [Paraburkholderia kururiensis]